MRAQDLRVEDLLDMDPRGGVVRFAGQRVLLSDAVALGLLRKQTIPDLLHQLTQVSTVPIVTPEPRVTSDEVMLSEDERPRMAPLLTHLQGYFAVHMC